MESYLLKANNQERGIKEFQNITCAMEHHEGHHTQVEKMDVDPQSTKEQDKYLPGRLPGDGH